MNVILEKDGEQRSYYAGNAMYLLLSFVPLIGTLITLILAISKKQFRGIFLNMFIYSIAFSIIVFAFTAGGVIEQATPFIILLYLVIYYYFFIMYVLNANYYSIRQRIIEGYVVVNGDDPQVKFAVEKAESTRKPFWQLTKF